MEPSPLVLQTRPETFQPKVVKLYEQAFDTVDDDDEDRSAGFWQELFLLKPDLGALSILLDELNTDQIIQNSNKSRQFLAEALDVIQNGQSPNNEHALMTLKIFLDRIFAKRYTSPSSDLIEILAGLDDVDSVFNNFLTTLDNVVKDGSSIIIRTEAVCVLLTIISGAYHTSLLTYFTQQDLFPSLIKLLIDTNEFFDCAAILTLCGLLANANKFEMQTPYQARLGSISQKSELDSLSAAVYKVSNELRDVYINTQNDIPEPWTVANTLSYIGLASFTGSKPSATVLNEDATKVRFSKQPLLQSAILLNVYDLVSQNRQFAARLIGNNDSIPHITGLLSFASYLLQHSHRSIRAASYSHLMLIILQILVEDSAIMKRLCDTTAEVRLCRQRPPNLPITNGDRPLISVVLDVVMDCLNHNLRTKIDIFLYRQTIGIMIRIVTQFSKSRTRLSYHWPELWRSLLVFIRFLVKYAGQLVGVESLVQDTIYLLAFCLTNGENFLTESSVLEDLFYKLLESAKFLTEIREAYKLESTPVKSSVNILLNAVQHFDRITDQAGTKSKDITAKDIMNQVRIGHETLSIESVSRNEYWQAFREQDYKVEIKRIIRIVVVDAQGLAVL